MVCFPAYSHFQAFIAEPSAEGESSCFSCFIRSRSGDSVHPSCIASGGRPQGQSDRSVSCNYSNSKIINCILPKSSPEPSPPALEHAHILDPKYLPLCPRAERVGVRWGEPQVPSSGTTHLTLPHLSAWAPPSPPQAGGEGQGRRKQASARMCAYPPPRAGSFVSRHEFARGCVRNLHPLRSAPGTGFLILKAEFTVTGGVEELHRRIAFRSWRMMGRAVARRATTLNPARANAAAVPVKIFDVLFSALVSTG